MADSDTMEVETLVADTKTFEGNFLIWRRIGDNEFKLGAPGHKSNRITFRHPTFALAQKEAERLSGLFPHSSFVIMQEIARVKMKSQSLEN